MSYLVAILGVVLIVPNPMLGFALFGAAAWWHQSGMASSDGEIGEILLFYAAILGIVCALLLP